METKSLCLAVADTPEGNYQYGWSYGNTLEGTEMIAHRLLHRERLRRLQDADRAVHRP